MPFALYFATVPAPKQLTREALVNLVPVHFSTEKDALHAAALVLRGGQFVWLLEGRGVYYTATQIEEKCKPMLEMLARLDKKPT